MLNLLAERPFLLTLILLACAAAAAFFWMQSGRKEALITSGVFLVLIPIGIYVGSIIVTDRESLLISIENLAAALQEEDHETVLLYIDPEADAVMNAAQAELPMYEFERVRVNMGSVRAIFLEDTSPTEATAEFMVNVIVSSRRGSFANVQALRRFNIRFRKAETAGEVRWRIVEYSHQPPIGGPDGYSANPGLPKF